MSFFSKFSMNCQLGGIIIIKYWFIFFIAWKWILLRWKLTQIKNYPEFKVKLVTLSYSFYSEKLQNLNSPEEANTVVLVTERPVWSIQGSLGRLFVTPVCRLNLTSLPSPSEGSSQTQLSDISHKFLQSLNSFQVHLCAFPSTMSCWIEWCSCVAVVSEWELPQQNSLNISSEIAMFPKPNLDCLIISQVCQEINK